MYQDKHIVHAENGISSPDSDHPSWRIHKWGGINLEGMSPLYCSILNRSAMSVLSRSLDHRAENCESAGQGAADVS
jgi:hypothetical protein